jgi:hypothetical protein
MAEAQLEKQHEQQPWQPSSYISAERTSIDLRRCPVNGQWDALEKLYRFLRGTHCVGDSAQRKDLVCFSASFVHIDSTA